MYAVFIINFYSIKNTDLWLEQKEKEFYKIKHNILKKRRCRMMSMRQLCTQET